MGKLWWRESRRPSTGISEAGKLRRAWLVMRKRSVEVEKQGGRG
jgi:hypothetical protein